MSILMSLKMELKDMKEATRLYKNAEKAVKEQNAKLANACLNEGNSDSDNYGRWVLERLSIAGEDK